MPVVKIAAPASRVFHLTWTVQFIQLLRHKSYAGLAFTRLAGWTTNGANFSEVLVGCKCKDFKNMVRGLGLEPRLSDPKSDVLPVRRSPNVGPEVRGISGSGGTGPALFPLIQKGVSL